MGAITPLGNSYPQFKSALLDGKSGAGAITRFDTTHFKTKFACEVKDFDPLQYLEKKDVRRYDLYAQFAIAAAEEAISDAGLIYPGLNKDRVGVVWCSGIGGINSLQDEILAFGEGGKIPRFNPFLIPKMIVDLAAGHISIRHGFRGMNFCVVSACASSTNGLIDALNYIRWGKADAIVCGGSEAPVNEVGIGAFNALKALSERNDSPETASRPFDLNRDGFVMGEGGGCLILESLDHALNRGAHIYAELCGGGMSADAYHITAPHPEGLGAQLVMRNALEDANLKPEDIDYINAHGTSTPLGDESEIKAVQAVFGEHAYQLNISSTKSMTGHLLGAAGIIEAIASVIAVKENVIPPTINHFTDDPKFDPRLKLTFNHPEKRLVKAALCNNFGFGGHNATVIFRKFES
jgi:3-oxoacyl-[acyl-carrier-protein] synthase II